MADTLPDQVLDQGIEDTESIDNDIDNLYNKFIAPIEKIRSISQAPPGKLQSNQRLTGVTELNIDAINKLESRLHAFYRMLGLPVVGGNGFYNPGFDPNPKVNTARDAVNTQVDDTMFVTREQDPQNFTQMFNGQGFDSTVWALVQSHPKPFNLLNSEPNPQPIAGREQDTLLEISSISSDIASSVSDAQVSFSSRMGFPITSARHILKPFNVNPAIDFSVQPADNKLCVPFLPDLQSTKLSSGPNVYLTRPGIEFILRSRLQDSTPDPQFLTNVQNIIKQVSSPSQNFPGDVDTNDLISTITALADQNNISNPDVTNLLSTFSSTQAEVVGQLIKTLKVVIGLLRDSITDLDRTKEKITFLPEPNLQGFVSGGSLRDSPPVTKLEVNLVTLQIKKLNANSVITIDQSLGNFATASFTDLEKTDTYDQQINDLTQTKTDAGNRGLKSIRTIEIITGEASGLGLVDILAIYTALWTIKEEELLGLLDQDAFSRLYNNNVDLRSSSVTAQNNGAVTNVSDALTALENQVGNILSFADMIFGLTGNSPQSNESGDPT